LNEEFRTGIGFDVHAFAEKRKLIIGGIEIPFEKGLAGHSDADVLLHAVCDALLGSLSLGDIGWYFPDTGSKFKDANSINLLSEVYKMVESKGYRLGNLDVTLILQRPKISPYIKKMREEISTVLNVDIDKISIKATTTEKLGFTGREEGVVAMATVLVTKVNE
jgi:2-C-methyl-D-erythritol 2,4-cyclodiphosphate synthase